MRKYLIAATVAASLLASQAVASDSDLTAGDRLGSPSDTSSNFEGMGGDTALFLIAGGILIGFVAYYASKQDNPTSP
jgi:hypothetical protein